MGRKEVKLEGIEDVTLRTDDLLTFEEASKILTITRMTVHRWIKSGKLTKVKLGKNVYLLRSQVEQLKQ